MSTATKDDARELLAQVQALAAGYRQEADKATQQAYLIGLADVPLADVKRAVLQALRSEEFMPTVARLRKLAGAEVGGENRAILAFEALAKLVSREGAYRSVLTDDPILNATINACGGWEAVCEVTTDDWHSHFRHRFLKTYGANLEAKRGTMQPQLGISDKQNTANGFEMSKPRLFLTGLPKVACITSDRPAVANALIHEQASRVGCID
jgi:hypothetical protein